MGNIFDTFKKTRDYLVCIDSDGCAMDTMNIKHFRCFGPCMIREWNLEQWEEPIQNRWNDINLFTMTRGINRFKALETALKEIDQSYIRIDGIDELSEWVGNAKELSNQNLKNEIEKNPSSILKKALAWSETVNVEIGSLPDEEKQPFEGVKESLEAIHKVADIAIVSSANQQAIVEEWEKHGLLEYTDILLSQNAGSKAFCIGKLLEFGYDTKKVLMVGDAPGDRDAAQKNGVLYYPILVKREKESWEHILAEALDKFLDNSYDGEYQQDMLKRFEENLK